MQELPGGMGEYEKEIFPEWNAEVEIAIRFMRRFSTAWFWRGLILGGIIGYLVGVM